MNVTAVILASGSGTRTGLNKTKQRIELNGKTVLFRTVSAFEKCESVSDIVVTVRADEVEFARTELASFRKVRKIVVGGAVRFESAKIGFESIDWNFDYVAIHDGARCFITPEMINKVCIDAIKHGAATASNAVTDTVKRVNSDGKIIETLDRQTIFCIQTPQVFKRELYAMGINAANVFDPSITDDNMLLERLGIAVHCTETGKRNIKITVPEDIYLALCLLNGEKDDD